MAYLSIVGSAKGERVIERSRFLSYARHVEDENEARAFLARLQEEHPLATHICYAFVADKTGNLMRFSDDGEPQGTAGMPILGAIKAKKLFETAVAVVRYFGGVKLGAGGLTRAYAGLAQDVLSDASFALFDLCVEAFVSVGYSEIDALVRFFQNGYRILNRSFGAGAEFTVAVRESEWDAFRKKLNDFLNGKVEIRRGNSFYSPT